MHYCPSCEIWLPDNAHFCSHCGYALETTIVVNSVRGKRQPPLADLQTHYGTVVLQHQVLEEETAMQQCPSCETENAYQAHFCSHCGHALNTTTTDDDLTHIPHLSADVEPRHISAVSHSTSTRSQKVLGKLPMPVQQVIAAVLTRAQDPKPEAPDTNRQKAVAQSVTWGWLPLLALTSTFGTLSVAHGFTSARLGIPGAEIFFWFGLLLIFVPATVRLISPTASRFERISLLCVVGICFYLVKVMNSPLYFSAYDEFLHWQTADDIARSGHLFSANALLPTSPFYPGLEIVTNAFSRLSGLSTFTSGTIVVGVAHLLLILALFMLCEFITGSARIAGLATILYMTNPNFLFFDAQYAYESLALPLATFLLFAMAYNEKASLLLARTKHIAAFKASAMAVHKRLNSRHHWITLSVWITLGAIVVTHHMTDYVFDGLLLLWTVIYALRRPAALIRSNLARTIFLGVVMSVAWMILPGNPVVQYLSQYFIAVLNELRQILTGASSVHPVFVSYSGLQTPLWQRVMEVSSVALITLGLPFGLLCLWQRYRHDALVWMLGIFSLFYPFSQVFRFTNFGAEITDRSAAFLYIAISCILAIFIAQFWPTKWLSWKQTLLIICILSMVFLGGTSVGSGPSWAVMPGPYLAAADERSIEPEGIRAATWTYSYLGPKNRIATDRTNGLLMSTYGQQRIVTDQEDQINVIPIFFSSSLGDYEVSILRQAQVRYLVVDLRLSQALPVIGFYFDEGEPGAFQHTTPIDTASLTKFNTIPQINRVFDSGDIVIYDVGALANST
jgi:Double zinc ribbon